MSRRCWLCLSQALLRLHAVRTAADAGTPLAEAIKGLRPPVFFKQQDVLAGQARRWTARGAIGADRPAQYRDAGRRASAPRSTRTSRPDFLIAIAKEARRQ